MYIVRLTYGSMVKYFSGIYCNGINWSAETTDITMATFLNAAQADEVGCYYKRVYDFDYTIERQG